MRGLWTGVLALLLVACGGNTAERGRAAGAPAPAGAPAGPEQPPAPRPEPVSPDLSYAQLDLTLEGEAPIRWVPVFSRRPRTMLEAGLLWAPVEAVVAVLSPQARVSWEAEILKLDGEALAIPVRDVEGQPWSPVAPLARQLGAYARVHPDDGSVVLWPRDALLWLRDHGDPRAPALKEAREAGLLN